MEGSDLDLNKLHHDVMVNVMGLSIVETNDEYGSEKFYGFVENGEFYSIFPYEKSECKWQPTESLEDCIEMEQIITDTSIFGALAVREYMLHLYSEVFGKTVEYYKNQPNGGENLPVIHVYSVYTATPVQRCKAAVNRSIDFLENCIKNDEAINRLREETCHYE